ncbi:tRNA lysidine(34) synthetase TilS, partial [candidate division WOR-3 bacterium]|nr:tRNA lysidine(34) synthetase TilS [candidate division WOR-3 bacterium]MBD3365240.1 tRNA lysidine(34) synthetase TilS [candidate division WOR-3 bacterium]
MFFVKKATKTFISECGYESGQSILVACSGGADSIALLRFLHSRRERLKIPRLGVFHLNHGLRGDEALADEEFVRKLTGELGLTFYPFREDVSAYAAKEAVSMEMAGRRLRYERLNEVCRREGYELAALGHTATDNVEWILLSLIRGRVEPLLWGIPARRERYIRPLIRCTRDEIIGYLKRLSQSYREDSSNISFSYDRNRIRHRIVPLLKEENPSLEETVSRTLMLGDFQKAFLDSRARELMDSLVIITGRGRELDTSKLSRYNPVTQLHILRLFVPWLR